MSDRDIQLKTRGELQAMRASGVLLARALDAARAATRPGITTRDLDEVVATVIRAGGAVSSFLNYGAAKDGSGGFTGVICASVNDEVVHGIPGDRVLHEGDLISIDAGCILDGWHADSAISLHVGEPPQDEQGAAEVDLITACGTAMWAGIAAAHDGGRLGDVSAAIGESVARSGKLDGRRYGSVSGYGGHGIGTEMHMAPFVPNEGKKGKGPRLVDGMALAIEPMVTLGKSSTRVLDDDWTVVTKDGSRAAHTEHSIAITADGICVLTAADGGVAGLRPFDVTPISLD